MEGTSEIEILDKGRMTRVEGYVYCHTHTCIHEDTLDPYGEGPNTCLTYNGTGVGVTKAQVHRTVYYRSRKGDIAE